MSSEQDKPSNQITDSQSEYYQQLFECSSFAIIGMDCQGIIISWNTIAEHMFNTRRPEMLGRHIEQIIPPPRRKLFHRLIERTVTQRTINEFEIEHKDQSGKQNALAAVITPVINPKNEILGLAAWVRDISNRKDLQNQLAESKNMASLGTLAAGVAHHFNNIVGGMATVVDFALQGNNPDTNERALRMTAEAAARMTKIIRSLLTFAEKDTHHYDLSDLTEIVMTFSLIAEKPLAEKNIELKLDLHDCPVYEVPGSRVHEMLGQLLNNAEQAMPDGGMISINLKQEYDEIMLVFSDTGTGIDAKDRPHVFEPFYTTRDVVTGGNMHCSGLGLSVVHGIVRELEGTIEVENRLPKGTQFTIRLPVDK